MGDNRGGRPKAHRGTARTYTIKARLSLLEYDTFKGMVKESHCNSESEFIREAVFNSTVVSRVRPEFYDMARDLMGVANNMNQAARMANTYGYNAAADHIDKAVDAVMQMINQMRKTLNQ